MRKRLVILLAAMIVLTQPLAAQSTPVPVAVPVHGKLAFSGNLTGTVVGPGNNQLLVVDTYSGNVEVLMQSDRGLLNPVWRQDGNALAFSNFLNGSALGFYDIQTQSFHDVLAYPGSLAAPQDWSPDGSSSLNVKHANLDGSWQDQLQIVTMSDGSVLPLFTYTDDNPAGDVPLPPGVAVFNFRRFGQVQWNPVHSD